MFTVKAGPLHIVGELRNFERDNTEGDLALNFVITSELTARVILPKFPEEIYRMMASMPMNVLRDSTLDLNEMGRIITNIESKSNG